MSPVDINKLSHCELNPRGNLWLKNENRFGFKMLSKMGWKKGKGLGKNEDGTSENVKVRMKRNNSGVGWVTKAPLALDTQEYDDVLANLGKVYGRSEKSTSVSDVESIEKRSQQFKHRLHYRKFIKGKDVCRYSDKDMNSIFVSKKKKSTQAPDDADAVGNATDAPVCGSSSESTMVTFKSELSMTDYFAIKMKGKSVESSTSKQTIAEASEESLLPSLSEDEVPKPSKKRKKETKAELKSKKRKLAESELESNPETDASELNIRNSIDVETCNEKDETTEKHKPSRLKKIKSCLKDTLKKTLGIIKKKISFKKSVSRRDIDEECNIEDSEKELRDFDDKKRLPYWKYGHLQCMHLLENYIDGPLPNSFWGEEDDSNEASLAIDEFEAFSTFEDDSSDDSQDEEESEVTSEDDSGEEVNLLKAESKLKKRKLSEVQSDSDLEVSTSISEFEILESDRVDTCKKRDRTSEKCKSNKLKRINSCLRDTLKKTLGIKKKVSFNKNLSRRDIDQECNIKDSEQELRNCEESNRLPYWKYGCFQDTDMRVEYIDGQHPNAFCSEDTFEGPFEDDSKFEENSIGEAEVASQSDTGGNDSKKVCDSSVMESSEELSGGGCPGVEEGDDRNGAWELPNNSGSNYDSWRESQLIAMKMKMYQKMKKTLAMHSVLKRTNMWELKGYGNWGL